MVELMIQYVREEYEVDSHRPIFTFLNYWEESIVSRADR